ncbi:MAG: DUF928 domain-containing protein [Cyanobacteria bacterium J06592_8]
MGDSCDLENPSDVIALNPVATVSYHPTLWFYLPIETDKIQKIEVALLKQFSSVSEYEIESEDLSGLPGFLSIDLPESENTKLQEGMFYQLLIYCGDSGDQGINIPKIQAQRQEIVSELQTELDQAQSEIDKARIYEQYGMWYDSITIIGKLHHQNPKNSEYQQEWQRLLQKVGLGELSDKPIISTF